MGWLHKLKLLSKVFFLFVCLDAYYLAALFANGYSLNFSQNRTKGISIVAYDHHVKKSVVVIADNGVTDTVEMTATTETVGDVIQIDVCQGIPCVVTNENVVPEEGEFVLKESDHDSSNTDLQSRAQVAVISVQLVDLANANVVLPEVSAGTTTLDKGGTDTPRHDVEVVRTPDFSGAPMSSFCHENTGYMAPQKESGFVDETDLLKLCFDEKEEAAITSITTSSTSSMVVATTAIPTSYIMQTVELDDFPCVVHSSCLGSSGQHPPPLAFSHL